MDYILQTTVSYAICQLKMGRHWWLDTAKQQASGSTNVDQHLPHQFGVSMTTTSILRALWLNVHMLSTSTLHPFLFQTHTKKHCWNSIQTSPIKIGPWCFLRFPSAATLHSEEVRKHHGQSCNRTSIHFFGHLNVDISIIEIKHRFSMSKFLAPQHIE